MESLTLDMDDIFDDHDEAEGAYPTRLPDLQEDPLSETNAAENDADNAENQEVLAKLKDMKGASKNAVKRTIPKLDSNRLIGERGIPVLPYIFKDIKLKGKNHEGEDLLVILGYLENWSHRLFPKMPFDEVLERIERLGTKKDVQTSGKKQHSKRVTVDRSTSPQTCIKKIRLDTPFLHSDVEVNDKEDEDQQNTDQTLGLQLQILPEDALKRIERNRQLAVERKAKKMSANSTMNDFAAYDISS